MTSFFVDDLLAGLAILVLWMIWSLLYGSRQLPVLPLAMTFQWTQVTCGLFYSGLSGRELEAIYASEYRRAMAPAKRRTGRLDT